MIIKKEGTKTRELRLHYNADLDKLSALGLIISWASEDPSS